MNKFQIYFLSALICGLPFSVTSCGDDDPDEQLNPPTQQTDNSDNASGDKQDDKKGDKQGEEQGNQQGNEQGGQLSTSDIDPLVVGDWSSNNSLSNVSTEGTENLSTVLGSEVDFASSLKSMASALGSKASFRNDGTFTMVSENDGTIQGTYQAKDNVLVLYGKNDQGVTFVLEKGHSYTASDLKAMAGGSVDIAGMDIMDFEDGLSATVESVVYSVEGDRMTVKTIVTVTLDLNKVEAGFGLTYAMLIRLKYPDVNPVQTFKISASSVYDKD